MSHLGVGTWDVCELVRSQLPCSRQLRLHGSTSSESGLGSWDPCEPAIIRVRPRRPTQLNTIYISLCTWDACREEKFPLTCVYDKWPLFFVVHESAYYFVVYVIDFDSKKLSHSLDIIRVRNLCSFL